MAHKKGQGSVKNGETASANALALKNLGASKWWPEISLSGSVERSFCPVKMLG